MFLDCFDVDHAGNVHHAGVIVAAFGECEHLARALDHPFWAEPGTHSGKAFVSAAVLITGVSLLAVALPMESGADRPICTLRAD